MTSKALVALALFSALSRPAWCQTATAPLSSMWDPYEHRLRKPIEAPQPDESEDDKRSDAVRQGADRAQGTRPKAAPDRSLNPYLAAPADFYGAAGASDERSAADFYGAAGAADERSAADLYGLSGSLDSLGGAPAYGLKPGPGLSAGPILPPLPATGLSAGPIPPPLPATGLSAGPSRPTLLNLHADPAASGLKDVTIERDLEPASAGRGDPVLPEPGVTGATPAKPRAGTLRGDSSGLLGFNPYDAKSIVAPTGAPTPGAPGATPQSFGAAGLTSGSAPSPPPTGLGASGKSGSSGLLNSPLPASLPSTLPSALGPAPLGPLR